MFSLFRGFLIVIVVACLRQVSCQDTIINYSKANELSSNDITTSFVDSRGIVWIGTNRGLNAFTGTTWHKIRHIENTSGKTKALGKVGTIYEDRNGYMWTSTKNGLFFYNKEYWIDFINDDEDYQVKHFFEDTQGRLWTTMEYSQDLKKDLGVVMINGTINMFDGSVWYEYDADVAGTASLNNADESDRYFTGIIEDTGGNIWLSSLESLYSYDGEDWNEYDSDEIDAKKIFALFKGNNDEIWLATESGVSRFSSGKWTNFNKTDRLTSKAIHILKMDPSGRIWAYTHSDHSPTGLNMFDGTGWTAFSEKDLHLKGAIKELLFADSAMLAFSGSGVSEFKAGKWLAYSRNSGLKDKKYELIKKDRFGRIWLVGNQSLYQLTGQNWESIYIPEDGWDAEIIFIDRRMSCWVGTKKNGIYRQTNDNTWIHYSEDNGLADNHIKDIFEDKRGNVWVVTNAGVTMFRVKTN